MVNSEPLEDRLLHFILLFSFTVVVVPSHAALEEPRGDREAPRTSAVFRTCYPVPLGRARGENGGVRIFSALAGAARAACL